MTTMGLITLDNITTQNMPIKLNDNQFKAMNTQYDLIDEQIAAMQDAKMRMITSSWITPQAFHQRRARLWLNKRSLSKAAIEAEYEK